ncbi:MAG: peptide-methionine (S)-S-oxide reductase MsrA [Spirochaetales bacterium]
MNLSKRLLSIPVLLVAGALLFASGEPEAAASDGSRGSSLPPAGGFENDPPPPESAATAVFAGGCFWCMEEAYEAVPGVYEAVSGYAGGTTSEPTYREVTGGDTGHKEVVRVYYDESQLSYEDLLYIFWRNVDLFDNGGQFCDRGESYLTGIFYTTDEQRRLAEESREEVAGRFSQEVVTPIKPLDVIDADANDGFWVAEEYHQDYYLKNPSRYNFYKANCGRVRRLEQIWGDEALAPSFTKQSS